jgi:soluble epoxide hydrolase/lipid-phosphate phosphatase
MRLVPSKTAVVEFKLSQELEYYITQNASFPGPLNYYRTSRIRFDEEKGKYYHRSWREHAHIETPAGDLPMTYAVKIPVLFLRGADDRTSPEVRIASMKELLPQTKVINYEGSGHWLMYQEKDNVAKDVLIWLSENNLTKL